MSSLKDRRSATAARQVSTFDGENTRLFYRRLGLRWRGKLPIPKHAHPLVRDLYREANRQHVTLTEIAAEAGIRRCSIHQWGSKNHPRIDQLDAALNTLGLRLAILPLEDEG